MTDDEKRTIKQVSSELYEVARVKRNDSDSTFVTVRRQFLEGLAEFLMTLVKGTK